MSNSSCKEIVRVAWNHLIGVRMDKEILAKVGKSGKDLLWWNKKIFGSIRQVYVQKKKKMLIRAEFETLISGNNFQVRELKN